MYLSKNLKFKNNSKRQKFYLFCVFWFIIALLQFLQDYISSVLNRSQFVIWESLAYKIFWLLFIPMSLLLVYGLNKNRINNKTLYFGLCCLKIILITVLHLFIFSFLLYGLSQLIHEDNFWQLSSLLTEKLSNYLYIAVSIYLVLVSTYFWYTKKDTQKKPQQSLETIAVKNGRKSTIVKVDSIKWISSDGQYILLYTVDNKKHILSDSLKNIITRLPENFKRIHRSTILNTNMVKALKSRMNGDYDVIMNDSKILRLSRNYTKPLKGTLL